MDIVVERGKEVDFEALPPESVALDGYVRGPKVDIETKRISFDHHGPVVRPFTHATCHQVLNALLLGFEPEDYTIYVNDVDGDVSLSVWLLQNPDRARETRVRRLVTEVAGIDAHGPSYPVTKPESELVERFFMGAMEPVVESKRTGEYQTLDLERLLETCVSKIDALVEGTLDWRPEEDTRTFEITHEGTNWVMARSTDFIFDLLYEEGQTRAIQYRPLEDGSWTYTVGKQSEFVGDFPVGPASKEGTILHALAAREEGWGGSTTIGGAPRNEDGSRSRLEPDEVFAIVEEVVRRSGRE